MAGLMRMFRFADIPLHEKSVEVSTASRENFEALADICGGSVTLGLRNGPRKHTLDIRRQQQVKSWELRAAMSLARLWQQQDKRQDAVDLLAPVYGWFTEGFDTADLKDAKYLLDELA